MYEGEHLSILFCICLFVCNAIRVKLSLFISLYISSFSASSVFVNKLVTMLFLRYILLCSSYSFFPLIYLLTFCFKFKDSQYSLDYNIYLVISNTVNLSLQRNIILIVIIYYYYLLFIITNINILIDPFLDMKMAHNSCPNTFFIIISYLLLFRSLNLEMKSERG
eukprot:gene4636-3339_t